MRDDEFNRLWNAGTALGTAIRAAIEEDRMAERWTLTKADVGHIRITKDGVLEILGGSPMADKEAAVEEVPTDRCTGLSREAVNCACPYCQAHPQEFEPGVLVEESA